jgi:tetratricopeptide (TPR) repeat protein
MGRAFIVVPTVLAIIAASVAADMAGRAGSRTAVDRTARWEACRIFDALGRPGPDADIKAAIDACTVIIRSGRQTRQDFADAYLNRGVAYHLSREDVRAIADYDEAVRLDPQNPLPFVRRADAYGIKGLHEKSMEEIDTRAAGRPPYTGAGRAWFDRAVEDYSRAIRLKPDVNFVIRRGNTHGYMGEYDRAIADYSEAIRLDPANAEALVNRAGVRNFALGDHERAITDYDTVIRLDPSWPLVFTARAFAYVGVGQFGRAIGDCDRALRLNPENNLAQSARCRARLGLGQLADALADCDAALDGIRDFWTLSSRGMVHLRMDKPDLALADFQEALTNFETHNAEALYGRGLAKRMKGDVAGAEADIAKAGQVAPDIASKFAAYGLARAVRPRRRGGPATGPRPAPAAKERRSPNPLNAWKDRRCPRRRRVRCRRSKLAPGCERGLASHWDCRRAAQKFWVRGSLAEARASQTSERRTDDWKSAA